MQGPDEKQLGIFSTFFCKQPIPFLSAIVVRKPGTNFYSARDCFTIRENTVHTTVYSLPSFSYSSNRIRKAHNDHLNITCQNLNGLQS